jgi:integrase
MDKIRPILAQKSDEENRKYFFLNLEGKKYLGPNVTIYISDWYTKCCPKLAHMTPHVLRHALATLGWDRGDETGNEVALFMGHDKKTCQRTYAERTRGT